MVGFVRDNEQAFKGVEDLVATWMGHGLRMWHEVYDLAINRRSLTGALAAMEKVGAYVRQRMEEEGQEEAEGVEAAAAAVAGEEAAVDAELDTDSEDGEEFIVQLSEDEDGLCMEVDA